MVQGRIAVFMSSSRFTKNRFENSLELNSGRVTSRDVEARNCCRQLNKLFVGVLYIPTYDHIFALMPLLFV